MRFTYSTGRNRTATERTGTLIHAVDIEPETYPSWHKALCGYQPKRLSNGWSEYEADEVTCKRCLKKMEVE